MTTATLNVTGEGTGIELRRGPSEIVVDGKSVGSFDRHETVQTTVEPGHHTLRIRKGRYSSEDRSFDFADGEVVNLRCPGAVIWFT
ncbi:MAG TPA: hypothetical protein VNG12_18175 [Acidimicrobiales bacterium]|nr:hypothetical protein [Acidimicrobiales bacterium]